MMAMGVPALLALAAVAVAETPRVAFTVATNAWGLKPSLVALLRVQKFYPDAGLFVVGDGDWAVKVCKRQPRDATTGPWWQADNESPCSVNARLLEKAAAAGIETLVVDHPLIDLIINLRYHNAKIHAHYKTPWPPHCYMPMVVPEILYERGYEYTVAIARTPAPNERDYEPSIESPPPPLFV